MACEQSSLGLHSSTLTRYKLHLVAVRIIHVHPLQGQEWVLTEAHLEAEALQAVTLSVETFWREFEPDITYQILRREFGNSPHT